MAQRTETTVQKTGDIPQTARTEQKQNAANYSFDGARIYVGPSSYKKGLRFGMGFRDGIPVGFQAECKECPSIFDLVVAPEDIARARFEIATKGSALNQAFIAVEEYIKGGGEE